MSASELGGAAPHAPATTIRSNNLVPRPIPQPSTENQRNPLVNCARDISCVAPYEALRARSTWVSGKAYQKTLCFHSSGLIGRGYERRCSDEPGGLGSAQHATL